ncbi:cellulose synthase [Mangrovibacter phragmitis]|uniref:Cellulose synthase n=1 Tax=Mangrovibacter phragmitis TaxID=1691903 RepID=A0A1B7L494_9ENTR|nr:cellulose biosynthesis protein BcsD [Mangrovibacter phragmitis]OAT77106.1 cellulose synthase [Mangrovibacter phragmitis]
MALNEQNSAVLRYFQQQQTPAGWFDMLTIMVDGMVRNVGEKDSHPFLTQMGISFGQAFPLPEAETVGELEAHINNRLAQFNWGIVDIDVEDNAMVIRHQALPVARHDREQNRWCNAFCAMMEGVYASWMRQQGGKDSVALWRDQSWSLTDVQFRYQGRF